MDENTALRKERNFARGLCAAFMLAIWILIGILLIGCQPSDEEPTYPQRAYACKLAHNEPDSVLKRYDVVYGYQEINHIADAKARLGSKPDFFATLHPTCTKETEPAEWEYWNAAHNFTEAMHVAAYENLKRGCDWFLRDASGNTLPMWTPDNQWKMLNLTEHCPPGVWEKTAGLTALDYLVGPMLDMITSEKSKSAYAGYVLEDGPDKHFWNYVWDTMGVSCVQLSATCRSKPGYFAAADSCVQRYLDDFVLAAGRRGMLMLTNGHHVLESCPSYDPAKWGAFSGCKLERFGDWGGCPKDSVIAWWEAYKAVEEHYGPIHTIGAANQLQGWDVSLCQIEARGTGTAERMRHMRCMAGLSCMGDAAFSVSEYHDHHGGEPDSIPPELDIPLGVACGPYKETADGLLYREFENIEEVMRGALCKVRRRVTVNLTDESIGPIPSRDAVWETIDK